ncbi:MAG: ArsR family transcriptional regulator [Planctomycetota bacterium]
MHPPQNSHIRPVDQLVIDALRKFETGIASEFGPEKRPENEDGGPKGMTVHDLTECLEVTATAIRQRLERLVSMELIARWKESIGRGRPQYRYCLTARGSRYAAASYADLATALWQELMELPSPQQRSHILQGVARRLGEGLKQSLECLAGATIQERMEATVEELGKRKVEATVEGDSQLPVLTVHSCPYPEISALDDGRQLCELEQEMLSDALGAAVQLDSCRLDGKCQCHFRLVDSSPEPATV